MQKRLLCLLWALVLLSCSTDTETTSEIETPEESAQSKPNILLIIADDFGLDASPGYDLGSIKPNMPILQSLINTGVRFQNLWSNPTCTPTRSTILTGKYGFRTDVLQVGDELSTSETSLQSYIDTNTGTSYNHAVIGKWHLSTTPSHPNAMGVNYYAGLLSGGVQSYWNWNLTENGSLTPSTEYTTSKFTDLAIDWIAAQDQPWFLWLAYNAPHTPFHLPPDELHYQGTLPNDQASIDANPLPYYMAMLEAMDTEIGRLLDTMSEEERANTTIIFIGDNGTPNQVVQEYNTFRAKGSVYQGGINVPMIISGKDVTRFGATEDALLNTTDLFATIADIAGTGTTSIHDSQSFKELLSGTSTNEREYAYAEVQDEDGEIHYTIRNATHKYIAFHDGSEALFNLVQNPLEGPNLLNQNQLPLSEANAAALNVLSQELTTLRDE